MSIILESKSKVFKKTITQVQYTSKATMYLYFVTSHRRQLMIN